MFELTCTLLSSELIILSAASIVRIPTAVISKVDPGTPDIKLVAISTTDPS